MRSARSPAMSTPHRRWHHQRQTKPMAGAHRPHWMIAFVRRDGSAVVPPTLRSRLLCGVAEFLDRGDDFVRTAGGFGFHNAPPCFD